MSLPLSLNVYVSQPPANVYVPAPPSEYAGDRHRSIPLSNFEPLSRVPGVKLFSIQKNDGREQLDSMTAELRSVNEALWDVEDEIRACERNGDFGPLYRARAVGLLKQRPPRCAKAADQRAAGVAACGGEIVYRPFMICWTKSRPMVDSRRQNSATQSCSHRTRSQFEPSTSPPLAPAARSPQRNCATPAK